MCACCAVLCVGMQCVCTAQGPVSYAVAAGTERGSVCARRGLGWDGRRNTIIAACQAGKRGTAAEHRCAVRVARVHVLTAYHHSCPLLLCAMQLRHCPHLCMLQQTDTDIDYEVVSDVFAVLTLCLPSLFAVCNGWWQRSQLERQSTLRRRQEQVASFIQTSEHTHNTLNTLAIERGSVLCKHV